MKISSIIAIPSVSILFASSCLGTSEQKLRGGDTNYLQVFSPYTLTKESLQDETSSNVDNTTAETNQRAQEKNSDISYLQVFSSAVLDKEETQDRPSTLTNDFELLDDEEPVLTSSEVNFAFEADVLSPTYMPSEERYVNLCSKKTIVSN
jgi:hypothetical protein